jgi:protein-tyrosine phosphatase
VLTTTHHRLESHLHRTRVVLPDITELTAVSFGSADLYAREVSPDFGLYLDERWQPPWLHEYLDWPDFGVPDDPGLVVVALESLLDGARAGQCVEIGCYGGHGRTGSALACLAILCGQAPGEAVSCVRAGYCERAVETDEQDTFVRNLTR